MIKKNLTITAITANAVKWENGKRVMTELPTVTTTEKVNEKNAAKRYTAINSDFDGDIFVTGFISENVTFEMDNETFMKYATKVTE